MLIEIVAGASHILLCNNIPEKCLCGLRPLTCIFQQVPPIPDSFDFENKDYVATEVQVAPEDLVPIVRETRATSWAGRKVDLHCRSNISSPETS